MRKAELTRMTILDAALALASRVGFAGLTIGKLADELRMSKSGLFAHFGSKEALAIGVLDTAAEKFVEAVLKPGINAPRGLARLWALFKAWLAWDQKLDLPGGCLFVAASIELDDQPGPVRDKLVSLQRDWHDSLAAAARSAIREGHFRPDVDADQFAFETCGIAFSYHHWSRLMRDVRASERALLAFERLIENAQP